MAAHEDVPAPARRAIRSTAASARRATRRSQFARGELVFVLDADNVLYPRCIERLVDALDADPGATFSYGMLEMFDEQGPVACAARFPWQPERLRDGNFIDAMALIRGRVAARARRLHDRPAAVRLGGLRPVVRRRRRRAGTARSFRPSSPATARRATRC